MNQYEINPLIVNISLKNQQAFKQLYELCSPKLYGLLIKIIIDKDLAADTLQEVFTKIWLNAEKCDLTLGNGWPWMCQLARNTAFDKLRKMHKYPSSIEEVNWQEDGEDKNQQWQSNIDLNSCLGKLNSQPRNAIILSYIHGFSHAQLSQKLALPLGTLKSTIRRAMKELELCLKF
ncbi:MAG: RNA polymerase sigma factor [Oceanospirillaceae bacterium]